MKKQKQEKYWGEISPLEMSSLNTLAEEIGWKNAACRIFNKGLQDALLNESRADWKYLTGIDNESKVLDIGGGLGAVSFSLAKSSKTVYLLEPVWERVRFSAIRIKQEGIQNIQPVCGNALDLPFSDNFFDCVSLNGVLEWVGYLVEGIKPNIVQEKVLKEVSRVLKPDGTIYIGIENRFALFYFLGVKDPHTGLPFINLLPRSLANLYHKVAKKKRYAVYLYSYFGYKNLLRQAGFKKIKFYTPLPSYRNFSCIFPLNKIDVTLKFWLNNLFFLRITQCGRGLKIFLWALNVLLNTPLKNILKYFTLDYSIVASKEKNPSDFFTSFASGCRAVRDGISAGSSFYYKGWRKKIMFYFKQDAAYPSYVLKIADNINAQKKLIHASEMAKVLNNAFIQMPNAAGKILTDGYKINEYCVLEKVAEGASLIKYLLRYNNSLGKIDVIFSLVRDYLINLQAKCGGSPKVMDNKTTFKNIVHENLGVCAGQLSLSESELQSLNRYIEDRFLSKENLAVPQVIQHGDFHPNNIIFRQNYKFTVIDWEYSLEEGLPLVDLLNFLFLSAAYVKRYKSKNKQKIAFPLFSFMLSEDIIDGEIFSYCFYEKNSISDLIGKHLQAYCGALRINYELRQLLFLVFIFQHLSCKKDFTAVFLEKGSPIVLC